MHCFLKSASNETLESIPHQDTHSKYAIFPALITQPIQIFTRKPLKGPNHNFPQMFLLAPPKEFHPKKTSELRIAICRTNENPENSHTKDGIFEIPNIKNQEIGAPINSIIQNESPPSKTLSFI